MACTACEAHAKELNFGVFGLWGGLGPQGLDTLRLAPGRDGCMSVCMYIYIYIYIYTVLTYTDKQHCLCSVCTHMYICVYIYIHTYIQREKYMHMCMQIYSGSVNFKQLSRMHDLKQ